MAMGIGHDLHLHMVRERDKLLHVALTVAKDRLALGAHLDKCLAGIFGALDLADAASATARTRLDEHRAPDALGLSDRLIGALEQIAPGNDGDARRSSRPAGGIFVTHAVDHVGRRAHEHKAATIAIAHEARLLRKKAVSRMDCRRTGLERAGEHGVIVEIALSQARPTDAVGLIGEPHMERPRIGRGIDRNGLDAHFATRSDHADRDLAAIGDQNLIEH